MINYIKNLIGETPPHLFMPADLCINYLMHFPAIEAIQAKFATFMFFATTANAPHQTALTKSLHKMSRSNRMCIYIQLQIDGAQRNTGCFSKWTTKP